MPQSSSINPKMVPLDEHDLEKLQSVRFQVVTVIPGGPAAAIRIVNLRDLVDLLGLAYQKGELVVRVQALPLDDPPAAAALAAVLGIRAASPVPKEEGRTDTGSKTVVLPLHTLMDPPSSNLHDRFPSTPPPPSMPPSS